MAGASPGLKTNRVTLNSQNSRTKEDEMNVRKLGFALLLGLCLSGYASASCTDGTLVGNYGFTLTGEDATGQLAATVGQLTADGKGNFTGIFTNSTAGVISSDVALTGMYSVKTNCTGTTTITPSGSTATTFSLVVVSNGGQFELVDTTAGSSTYGYALAQGKATCTNAGVKNTYGFRGGGYAFPSLAPNAWVGQVKLDGLGGYTGSETASLGGTIERFSLTGTYSVNSNCTGTETSNGSKVTHTFFVIVNGGQSSMHIQTDANTINTNFAQK
jgi:hypothetical protein